MDDATNYGSRICTILRTGTVTPFTALTVKPRDDETTPGSIDCDLTACPLQACTDTYLPLGWMMRLSEDSGGDTEGNLPLRTRTEHTAFPWLYVYQRAPSSSTCLPGS